MDEKLSPAQAGAIAGRGRMLLRAGKLTHHQLALLDALLWTCRRAGASTARVSYRQLMAAAHLARSTVAAGLVVLERLGLIQKARHRLLAIGANGGRVWRQLASSYRLLVVSRGSEPRTDSKNLDSLRVVEAIPSVVVKAAQDALKEIATRRQARRAEVWLKARSRA